MVTFISLFLGLMTGVHVVQVAVDGPVARVEIVLDQTVVRVLTGPSWRGRCDFGTEIEPHELVAIAYDADGNELDRARQLINLPRPMAEVSIALASDENGRPFAARVFWESTDMIRPLSVHALFDGFTLQPDDDGLYLLPPYDLSRVHIVSAEARFMDGITARSDAIFGGRYGSDVATDLTAIPIRFDGKVPKVDHLRGLLRIGDQNLVPVAVEKGGFRVQLVRDQAAVAQMARIRDRQDAGARYPAYLGDEITTSDLPRGENQLSFVVANPIPRQRRYLYPMTAGISLKKFDIRWLVTHLRHQDASVRGQRLADAVAVAAVRAAADGTPRAVLLVLSDTPGDSSRYTPEAVRKYLRALSVPLFVWHTGSSPPVGWEPAWGIEGSRDLKRAEKALRRELSKQCVVWVDGDHMVNRVELADGADGLRLAGK